MTTRQAFLGIVAASALIVPGVEAWRTGRLSAVS
jgi:hypothetical protein